MVFSGLFSKYRAKHEGQTHRTHERHSYTVQTYINTDTVTHDRQI